MAPLCKDYVVGGLYCSSCSSFCSFGLVFSSWSPPCWVSKQGICILSKLFVNVVHLCCNSLGLEHMVLALWCRVPITLYLEEIAWWLSHCIYKSVCLGFLETVVARLPSSPGIINMSRKGMDPSSLGSSVNWMWWSIELIWSKKLFVFELLLWWQMCHLQIFSTSKGVVVMY